MKNVVGIVEAAKIIGITRSALWLRIKNGQFIKPDFVVDDKKFYKEKRVQQYALKFPRSDRAFKLNACASQEEQICS